MDTSKTNRLPASEQTVTTTREVPPSSSRKKGPAPSIPKPDSTASPATQPEVNRPCPEHNFLTDVADVRQMEKGLLLLLEDFHKGKLQVFGKGCTFEQMDQVRERQERLSRLHFDLDAQQQMQTDSDEVKDLAFKNLNKLVENLEDLNKAVHELKTGSVVTKPVPGHSSRQK